MSKSEWMEEQKQKKQCQILKKGSKCRIEDNIVFSLS